MFSFKANKMSAPPGIAIALLLTSLAVGAQEKITYEDQVTPILRNRCFSCHNADKSKGDLDLSTYSALLKGGGSGKAVLPGDADGSKLFKSIAQTEEPFMPFNSPKMPDAEIEIVRKWIMGGLLEKSTSKALAGKPKMDLALKPGSAGKPDGPAVLPIDWLIEPVQHTERANAVTALAASPWSPVIAVGGQSQVLLYHSETLELAGIVPLADGNPECLQFSRDGRLLIVGGGHGAKVGFVDLYDVAGGQRLSRVGNEFDSVLAADLNSDQTEVALGGPAKHVKVFSTRDGVLVRDLKKHTDWVTAIQYSPDSVLLATGDRNGGLVVWEADSGQELYTLTGHQAAITSVSWRDDSQVLLSASEDGSIHLWDMREGQEAAKWTAHKDGVLDARFAHDARIVSCGRDRQIAIWDAGGKKLRSWDAGEDLPARAVFSHDGARVFAGGWSGKVGIWAAADGKPAGEVTPNPLTLAERLEMAKKEVPPREAALAEAEQAVVAAEAEAAKIKAALSAVDQSTPSFQFVAATRQARAAQAKAAEEAKKALENLKLAAVKSAAQLAASEGEVTNLQVALDAFKEATRRLDEAGKQVSAARSSAEHDRAEVADLQAVLEKITASVAAADAETTKAITTMARIDPGYQHYVELEKQLESASQKAVETRTAADKPRHDLAGAQAEVTRIRAAQTNVVLHSARESLAVRQQQHEKLLAAAASVEDENAKVLKELDLAQERVKALTQTTNAIAIKLEAARTAVADSARQLATGNENVSRLAAEHARLKSVGQ